MNVRTNMQIAKCKMKNEKWGGDCNQHFAFCIPPQRRGLSLIEVLIAMGILTVGLLGVAMVFPVGSFYMQKAEIADRGSAIAQSVMNDIVARGMLNPWAWYVMVPTPASGTNSSPNLFFSGIDGKYAPLTQPATTAVTSSTFTRPFGEALSEGLKRNTDVTILAKQFGHAFVIDPMFAAAAARNTANAFNVAAYPFPATAYATYPWPTSVYYGTIGWDPWRAANRKGDKTWPIRRVTFQQATGWPLDKTLADNCCRGKDDLTTDLPPRDDRPAKQNWDISSAQTPLARQWTGEYSWIATVVPGTNAARDGMARNPESFSYDVSVVVFYKRTFPSAVPQTGQDLQDAVANERMVGTKIISTGLNGGELLLSDMVDVTDSSKNSISPFGQLRTGQWIMLCGPHPNSNVDVTKSPSVGEPRFVLSWYQVLSIETESTAGLYLDPNTQRIVTVRGPQWPWQPRLSYPSGQQNSDVAKLSDDLCVGIFRGAVAVHTKTLRLESPRGSTMNLVTPGKVSQPPFTF